MNFALIAAVDETFGIGKNNLLPWRLPSDLAFFTKQTRGDGSNENKNAVIMGRSTWESLPTKSRPLVGRFNIVMTRGGEYELPTGVALVHSLDEALLEAKKHGCREAYIIGGAQIFSHAIIDPRCTKLYLTHVQGNFDCDTFFPPFEPAFVLKSKSPTHTENNISFHFATYERPA